MKIDDAETWFLAFEQPDTPQEAGSTHIGIFFAWALLKGLGAARHHNFDFGRLQRREFTGPAFLRRYCDGKLLDAEDLAPVGAAFAASYYPGYMLDYLRVFGIDANSAPDVLARVPDTWASFDRVSAMLDERLAGWLRTAGASFAPPVPPAPWAGPPPAGPAATFAAGAKVRHVKFGTGVVLHAEVDRGQERVLVAFEAVGEKWLDARFAKLERLT